MTSYKLTSLDLSLDDVDGKTSADHIAEREVFGESEIGIYDAFEAFASSGAVSSSDLARCGILVDMFMIGRCHFDDLQEAEAR